MRAVIFLLAAILVLNISPQAHAFVSPLSISVAPPFEFPPGDFTVGGARLSVLWGDQRNVYGIDLGLLGNVTELTFAGIAVSGLFNLTHGSTTAIGLQAAGVVNMNTQKTKVVGLQIAGLFNANYSETHIVGMQLALLSNISEHTYIYGVQASLYNRAYEVVGFQIGLINYAKSLHGIQIGLLNFNPSGLLAVSPGINMGF